YRASSRPSSRLPCIRRRVIPCLGMRTPELFILFANLAQGFGDLLSILHGAIVTKLQHGYLTHAETWLQMMANEPGRRFQGLDRGPSLLVRSKHTDIHPGRAEVRRDLHIRDAKEPDSRILHLTPDDIVE